MLPISLLAGIISNQGTQSGGGGAGTMPTPPSSGFVTFTLTSPSTGTYPFSIGHTFKQGDLPSGSTLTGLQCTIKNTWPDGSAKIAVLSGGTSLTASTPKTIGCQIGSAPTGSNLTPTDLAALITQSIVFSTDSFGSATFTSTDILSPFLTWVSGPLMSSFIYRKQVGSDAHLVAWMEVRFFLSGEVEVLPWVENGYILVASPSNKSAVYTFTLGGSTRETLTIDLKHHQRTVLISGTKFSHWLSTDPGVTVLHNPAYMMATELVPSYYAGVSSTLPNDRYAAGSFTPLQQGDYKFGANPSGYGGSDNMADTGYGRPIGLLPEWDMLPLVCNTAKAYEVCLRNGYSAGRYGIHYRDENTNRPLKFSDYPTLNIRDTQGFKDTGGSTTGSYTPVTTGGNPPTWDVAHSPAIGFMPYLLTGRFYFMEETLFAATANYLGNGDNAYLRTGALGLVQTAIDAWQTRSSAWDWRAHVHATCVVPDNETVLRTQFINRTHNNIDYFWQTYVNQSNNQFGFILPGETYNSTTGQIAIWQQDFVTGAWGYGKSLGLPIDTTRKAKMDAFFAWKAKSVIGRLGTTSDFPFENANRYILKLNAANAVLDYTGGTGPWPADWAEIYSLTAPLADISANPIVTPGSNTLATEFDSTAAAKGIWGDMQMAIVYAVRHGVVGASAAYNRMIGASNWNSMLTSTWASTWPVLSVKPYIDPVAIPAWMSAAGLNRWTALPNSTGAGGASTDPWGGWVIDENLNIYFAASGGHGDSYDNRVTKYPAGMDNPSGWTVINSTSTSVPPPANQAYYYDVGGINPKPGSRHIYDHAIYDQTTRRIYLIGNLGTYPNGGSSNTLDGFNIDTNTWDAPSTYPYAGTSSILDSGGIVYCVTQDKSTGKVFWMADGYLWEWVPGSGTKTQRYTQYDGPLSGYGPFGALKRFPNRWDSSRNAIFGIQSGDGQGYGNGLISAGQVLNPSSGSPTGRTITFNSGAAFTQLQNDLPSYGGMGYDVLRDRFVFFAAGTFGSGGGILTHDAFRLYDIIPNSGTVWDVEFTAVSSTAVDPGQGPSSGAGVNGRFEYVQRGGIGGFLYMPKGSSGLFFFRTT